MPGIPAPTPYVSVMETGEIMRREDGKKVLVINPGSTSTKVAVFVEEQCQEEASLPVSPAPPGKGLWAEFPTRLTGIHAWLEDRGIACNEFSAVVGRGGLLRPVEGGTYLVSEAMLSDARSNVQGSHASNLGSALAQALAEEGGRAPAEEESGSLVGDEARSGSRIPAFVVDPVSTDEFDSLARISGLREIPRRSLSHALSIHALAREACRTTGRALRGSRFVVAHLGGGISVSPVVDGRIVDCNNANSGGPFSPSRSGGLPVQELLELVSSGEFSPRELRRMTTKGGGLVSYLGTDNAKEVEARMAAGDQEARRIYEAMAYQIAKEIGAMATVLSGRVDRILLTGGLAQSRILMGWVRERVSFIAPVEVWPKVEEMRALAQGALRVLRGEENAKEY